MTKNIALESTTKVLTNNAGQFLLNQLWGYLDVEKKIKKLLPRKKRSRGAAHVQKIKSLLFSFALGGDCLSDLDDIRTDKLFCELTIGGVASRAMGDFLRSFGRRHIERLQNYLLEMALDLRLALHPDDKKFILTMDSTPHEQCGQQMQGVAHNHKNMWCLDSQNAFDQYGLSYLFDLRPGNTFSGKDAEIWIHQIFSKVPSHLER